MLLTNYVVAVMTDRYVALQESRLGLYYDDLLANMAEYKYDSRYGFLIISVAPFNLLSFICAPFFIVIKKEDTLKRINWMLLHIGYLPVAALTTTFFFTINVILLPFALVAALLKKFKLLVSGHCKRRILDILVFVMVGWLTLPVAVVVDTCHFFRHLFS